MPVSMTLFLRSHGEAKPQERRDRVCRAVLRHLVESEVLPEAALTRAPHAYTLSPLLPAAEEPAFREEAQAGQAGPEPGGERLWLRLTWLDDSPLEAFLRWAPAQSSTPLYADLDSEPFLLLAARVSPSPADKWSRVVPYARLFEEASDTARTATLKFCSHTLLNRGGVPYPLPEPLAIFQGYLHLWRAFSGIALDPALRTTFEEELVLVDFRLRALPLEGDRGKVSTTFTGSATFRLDGRHPESVIRGFNTLADYALFCGTGTGTQRGMGLTRRITSRPD